MDKAQKEKVGEFLKEFKKIVTTGRGLDIIPRRDNIDALAKLGMTKKNRKDEILALSVADYCEGPIPDRDKPGEIWVFGKCMGGKEVYIKLKIAHSGNEKIAKCLSFHAAQHPLCFPFKEKQEEGGSEE